LLTLFVGLGAYAAALRSVDEALNSIFGVLNRRAATEETKRRNIMTALAMLDRFERDYPEPSDRATARFMRAQCYIGLERPAEALAEIDSALALPLDARYGPVALYLRGRTLVLMDRRAEGIAAIRAMLVGSPRHEIAPEARLAVAQAIADDGDGAAAVALLDTVVRDGAPMWAVQTARMLMPSFRMIGRRAPDFDVPALDGGRISPGGYRGKVILIDFWATWCGPCRMAMPEVRRIWRRYHDRGFEIVGISLDRSPDALRDYLARSGIPWRQVYQGGAWNSQLVSLYSVEGIPATFLVDKDGTIRSVNLSGERLEQAVQRLLAEP